MKGRSVENSLKIILEELIKKESSHKQYVAWEAEEAAKKILASSKASLLSYVALSTEEEMRKYLEASKELLAKEDVNSALELAVHLNRFGIIKVFLDSGNITDTQSDVFKSGLNSNNTEIQTMYCAHRTKLNTPAAIDEMKIKIEEQIARLEKNGLSFYGIGNKSKAKEIKEALDRALNRAKNEPFNSLADFLKYKENDGQKNINEALAIRRKGGGKADSLKKIEEVAQDYKSLYFQ